LVAWQKARALAKPVYELTRGGSFAKDFGLRNRHRPAEFHQFLSVAKSSCAEVRSQLYVALDVGYITETEFIRVLGITEEVSRIVSGLRASVEKQKSI
jgi:hypothetical protein